MLSFIIRGPLLKKTTRVTWLRMPVLSEMCDAEFLCLCVSDTPSKKVTRPWSLLPGTSYQQEMLS